MRIYKYVSDGFYLYDFVHTNLKIYCNIKKIAYYKNSCNENLKKLIYFYKKIKKWKTFVAKKNMKFIIKSKEIEISDDVKNYVEKRIGKLERFLEDVDTNLINVVAEYEKISNRHKQGDVYQVNINLDIPGKFFRFEARGENLYAMVDEAENELENEIQKFKRKKETLFKRGARSFKKLYGISPLARFRKNKNG